VKSGAFVEASVGSGEGGSVTGAGIGDWMVADVATGIRVARMTAVSGSLPCAPLAKDDSTKPNEATSTIPTPKMTKKGGRFLRSIQSTS